MGKVAAALGMGSTIEHQGVTYKLSPWTYKIQGEFEQYLQRNVMQVYQQMAPYMSAEERKEELSKIRREIAAGEYTFGSDLVAKAMASLTHLTHLFWLMLKPNHPDVTLELAAAIMETQAEEAMGKMSEANADPSTPATT